MKILILGLGNFGSSLAMKLTILGHEVIGVDTNLSKVESLKERLTHTICLDCSDPMAVSILPVNETDIAIVAIGEDEGANIMATALMKQLGARRLISRAVSPLHETVLQAMGVDEIVHPEEETADRWAKKLDIKGIIDSFAVSVVYNIVEAKAPEKYVGRSLKEIGFRRNHNVLVLTTIKYVEEKSVLGNIRRVQQVQGVISSQTIIEKDDILVIYGDIKDIKKVMELH